MSCHVGCPPFPSHCASRSPSQVAPINAYFEKVFVMAEDEKVRNNRLAFLRDLAALPRGVVDLSQLPGF